MYVYIASDHAGYEMKEKLINYFKSKDISYKDCGAYEYNEIDNYTDFIHACMHEFTENKKTILNDKSNIAIVIGGSGTGEAIVANRYKGVRAIVVNSENKEIVQLARMHNDANVISIGARFVSFEFVLEALEIFLNTEFDDSSRHAKRVQDIDNKL